MFSLVLPDFLAFDLAFFADLVRGVSVGEVDVVGAAVESAASFFAALVLPPLVLLLLELTGAGALPPDDKIGAKVGVPVSTELGGGDVVGNADSLGMAEGPAEIVGDSVVGSPVGAVVPHVSGREIPSMDEHSSTILQQSSIPEITPSSAAA